MKVAIERSASVELHLIPGKGRGVVAAAPIAAGEIIEIAPVVRLTEDEETALNDTVLESYVFVWGEEGYPFALVMGIISLINHKKEANTDLDTDYETQTMRLTAARDIAVGEEITIDYDCEIWFEEHH